MYGRALALGLMMILWGGAARAGEPGGVSQPTVMLWEVIPDPRCASGARSLAAHIEQAMPRDMFDKVDRRYVPVTALHSLAAPGSRPDSVLSAENVRQSLEALVSDEVLTVELTCSGEGAGLRRRLAVQLTRRARLLALLKTSPQGSQNRERWFKTLLDGAGGEQAQVDLAGMRDHDLREALEQALSRLLGFPSVSFEGTRDNFPAGSPVQLPFSLHYNKSPQSSPSQYELLVQVWLLPHSHARTVCAEPEQSVPLFCRDGQAQENCLSIEPVQGKVLTKGHQIEFDPGEKAGSYLLQLQLHAKNPDLLSSQPRYRCVAVLDWFSKQMGAVELQLLGGRAFLPGAAARGLVGATVLGSWNTHREKLNTGSRWRPEQTLGVGLGFVYVGTEGTEDPLKTYEVDVRVQVSLDWRRWILPLLPASPRLYFTGSMGIQHVAGSAALTADGLMGSVGVGLGIRGWLRRDHRIGVSALAQYRERFAALSGASSADLAAKGAPAGAWSLAAVVDGDILNREF